MNQIVTALLIAVIAVGHGSSCAGTTDSVVQERGQLRVGQTQLRLEERSGMCNIISSTEQGSTDQYVLNIPWPCAFHTDKAGNIRTVHEAGYVYVLVESSRRKTNQLNDCETQLQSVRARGNSIEVSQHMDRVASCPPFQWDTILFKELFN